MSRGLMRAECVAWGIVGSDAGAERVRWRGQLGKNVCGAQPTPYRGREACTAQLEAVQSHGLGQMYSPPCSRVLDTF